MSVIDLKNYALGISKQEPLINNEKEDDEKCFEWRQHAYECVVTSDHVHQWMVTSWILSPNSKHASMFMCQACFHQINSGDLHKYRYRLTNL